MMPFGIEIKNKTEDIGEIYLYGDITDEKWYDTDVTPKDLLVEMAKLKSSKEINLYINSGGGGVFAGMAIYNMIKRLPQTVTAYVDGIAASIASVIALAADKVVIPKNALFMIHNPLAGAVGEASDLRKVADVLDTVKDTLVSVYMAKAKISDKEVRDLMDAETWMTGEEAQVFGFADEMTDDIKMVASVKGATAIINDTKISVSNFKSFPKNEDGIEPKTDDIQEPKEPKTDGIEEPLTPEPMNYSVYENEITLNALL